MLYDATRTNDIICTANISLHTSIKQQTKLNNINNTEMFHTSMHYWQWRQHTGAHAPCPSPHTHAYRCGDTAHPYSLVGVWPGSSGVHCRCMVHVHVHVQARGFATVLGSMYLCSASTCTRQCPPRPRVFTCVVLYPRGGSIVRSLSVCAGGAPCVTGCQTWPVITRRSGPGRVGRRATPSTARHILRTLRDG